MNKQSANLNLTEKESIVIPNEERFRALVTATSDIVYSMSPDWSIMQQMDGRGFLADAPEPIKDWQSKYIHPEDRELVDTVIQEAIRTKSIFQLEHRVLQADGTPGWTQSRAVPILNNNGGILEWFGAASDITERKLMEEALREAKEQSEQQKRLYEAITSSTPDLVYVFDLNYRFTYANEALLSMWGKTWESAIGKGLLENGYEPWHAEMHEREIDDVKTNKQPIRGEVSFPHATLGRRIYDYIFTPVINARGEVEAVAGTTRDITDIRNAETAISESEARFRTMAENTDVMIAVGDELGNAIYFNEAWTTLTGLSNAELLEHGWINLMHPDDKDRVISTVTTALEEKVVCNFELRIKDSKGNYRWLLNRATPRFRSNSSFAGYISSTIDITEIKENEQRKNDFIGMVSHELKTPLTSLSAIIQVANIKLKNNTDKFLTEAMDKAGVQVRRMSNMINGFLNISRLESAKLQIEKQHFNLAQLLNEMVAEAQLTSAAHNITIEAHAPVLVNADRDKISSVISNLINNAVKYSPNEKKITVNCQLTESTAIVSVSDKGIGIESMDLDKIFDRFYRVNTSHTRHISGFGIGLYLSAEIIAHHNGEIWAESKGGSGSTFYFSLPLAK